ncbi:MAG: nucleoside deaminase [Bacteroidales bacterium]|nr:nucleoside deaminase [Bacteroidales bacterium]
MVAITFDDQYFMRQALQEAMYAKQEGEVPIGCVIVCNDKIIARGHNMTQRLNDSTSHAEMIAITSAEEYLASKYLTGCTLYVTVEPCLMCAGAILFSHIDKIVYGTKDEKRGFSSYCNPYSKKMKIVSGVLEDECRELIQDFFKSKRDK